MSKFSKAFYKLSIAACANSSNKGFWEDGKDRNKPEMICLMHSELSEMLEGYRKGNPPDEHCPEFSSMEVELADCIIRIMDFSAGFDMLVGEAVEAKMKFNKTRPNKHGKIC